jgi:subtilisin family serine protease
MIFKRNKNDCGLLPFIREDIKQSEISTTQYRGWEIEKFNIPSKWKYSQGENVRVAVIDTGCDLNHEDLKNNFLQGKNFVEKNKDPIDVNGHGTHVSSTIAAENNGNGIVGVAPKTKILPVKALGDEGTGDLRNIIDAIIWSADQKVDLITMSLGAVRGTDKLHKAIQYASNKGSVVFCAAGNSGEDVNILYPANYPETVSIGAIDVHLNRTSFTCSGDELDFLAPGHDIVGAVPGNNYAIMSGTSMSNPYAVGCASLLLSYMKKNHYANLPKTANDYISIFKETAIHLQNPKYKGNKKYEGYGIIVPEWKI